MTDWREVVSMLLIAIGTWVVMWLLFNHVLPWVLFARRDRRRRRQ